MKRLAVSVLAAVFSLSLVTAAVAAEKKAPAKPAAEAAKPAQPEKKAEAAPAAVDINTATEEQLKSIPGVGDAYSKKIIAGRPYAKKDQLKSKKIIPDDVYEKIKDKIIAKQAKK